MASLFGAKKSKEKTVLIIDIENGSVACALALLTPNQQPKLFAEVRTALPIFPTFTSGLLIREIEKVLGETLAHTSLVAARMRGHEHLSHMGRVSEALVFFAPPWAALTSGKRGFEWNFDPALVSSTKKTVESFFGSIPVSLHAFGAAATDTTNTLFEQQGDFLLCSMTGEMTELMLVQNGALAGRGTVPLGTNTLVRTLQSHSNLSPQEARSVLRLANNDHMPEGFSGEPLRAAAAHVGAHMSDITKDVLQDTLAQGMLVIAPQGVTEWLARTLAQEIALGDLFVEGAPVRALHPHHLSPHVMAHAQNPDIVLMLEGLFVAGSKRSV